MLVSRFGEAAGVLVQEAKQHAAVDGVSTKTYFRHLINKTHLKVQKKKVNISLSVCHQTTSTDGKLLLNKPIIALVKPTRLHSQKQQIYLVEHCSYCFSYSLPITITD